MEDKSLERSVGESVEQTANRLMGGLLSMHLNRSDLLMWLGAERDKLNIEVDRQTEKLCYENAALQSQITALRKERDMLQGEWDDSAGTIKHLNEDIDRLKELINGASLHGAGTETGVSLVDDVRDLVKERDRLTYAIGEWKKEEVLWKEREADLLAKLSVCKEALESMKVSMGMWLDRQDGHADPELCRIQHRHALRLYEKALAKAALEGEK